MENNNNNNNGWTAIEPSKSSQAVSNPIRAIVDRLKIPKDPNKELISLSIGDPTVFGNLTVPENIEARLIKNIKSHKFNGYAHSAGYTSTKESLVTKYTFEGFPKVDPNSVVMTSGCSSALEMSIHTLCDPGTNILLPKPGFSLYQTICDYKGVEAKHYQLLPEDNWQADLKHMESLADSKTRAILVNNPSNPCGSVYSKEHLLDIIALAEKLRLPIIADEIYGDLVFEGNTYHPLASLSKNVPILQVGGLAKLFMVPGWRMGWIIPHDRNDLLVKVRASLLKLSQVILGPNTLIQSVVEEAILNTPEEYHEKNRKDLCANANILAEGLSQVPGLTVIKPGGAMYMMIGIKVEEFADISDDVEWSQKLLKEESVMVLPGSIFKAPNFVRLVLCPSQEKLMEAVTRIKNFCARNHK